jgi:hypothetical protein
MKNFLMLASLVSMVASSCTKEKSNNSGGGGTSTYNLVFKYHFDSTQARLNNIGLPAAMPAGNAGQSPRFNGMSAHYLELSPGAFTPLGKGTVVFKASETSVGGGNAIDFEKCTIAGEGVTFFTIPIKDVTPGAYEWLRLSLAYQNYDVTFRVDTTIATVPIHSDFTGTVASFIGFNTYIKSYKVKTDTIIVNGNRKQGYWGLETSATIGGFPLKVKEDGQAPDGATTVVNPIASSSPIPAGSCVVTAAFPPGKLVITGNETKDIVIEVSLSTNKSFEWKEVIKNGMYEPFRGEVVVDMGIRGMIPTIK